MEVDFGRTTRLSPPDGVLSLKTEPGERCLYCMLEMLVIFYLFLMCVRPSKIDTRHRRVLPGARTAISDIRVFGISYLEFFMILPARFLISRLILNARGSQMLLQKKNLCFSFK